MHPLLGFFNASTSPSSTPRSPPVLPAPPPSPLPHSGVFALLEESESASGGVCPPFALHLPSAPHHCYPLPPSSALCVVNSAFNINFPFECSTSTTIRAGEGTRCMRSSAEVPSWQVFPQPERCLYCSPGVDGSGPQKLFHLTQHHR